LRTVAIDPDATLLRRYRATADRSAFEALFRKYQAPIFGFVCRMVGNEEAYDLTQEVFLRALRALHAFKGECSFRTWLYTIARNVCFNHCREKRRKQQFEELLGGDAEDEENESVADLPDMDGDVAKLVETRELQQLVGHIMQSMPDEQRLLITLRDFDGLSYEEVAQITDMSIGNVKSKLHRARLAFKKRFQPYLELVDAISVR
jgi:RNA polymerase sigma-70 factor (ECF subfamily)